MTTALIIPASGRGQRFGEDKLFTDVLGTPLIALTFRAVAAADIFRPIVVACPEEKWKVLGELAARSGLSDVHFVEGGSTRQQSVYAALDLCADAEVICVHDAARPLCPPRVFAAVVAGAATVGAATAALPCVDTIKRVHERGTRRTVQETLDRSELVAVQTPQAFIADVLRQAHQRALRDDIQADDDCALVERGGGRVAIIDGDPSAFKVTRPTDLVLLRALVAAQTAPSQT